MKKCRRLGLVLGALVPLTTSSALAQDREFCQRGVCLTVEYIGSRQNAGIFYPSRGASANRYGTPVYYAYAEGERGREYVVKVRNNRRLDALACLAIDGENVLTRRRIASRFESNRTWENNCYIVRRGETATIRGWRRGRRQYVNQFVFTTSRESAAQDPLDVGTMVLAVFDQEDFLLNRNNRRQERFSEGGDQLGTGAGREVDDPVREVPFYAEPRASVALVLSYLTERGIERRIRNGTIDEPDNFARNRDGREQRRNRNGDHGRFGR